MNEIKININCDGKHCGDCHLKEYSLSSMFCNAFGGEIKMDLGEDGQGEFVGYLRLQDCLDAETKDSVFPFVFRNKHNVRHQENEACCGNCQNFILDNTQGPINLKNLKTQATRGVRIGDCLLAKEEKSPIIQTIDQDVCDAHKFREAQNGNK